MHFIFPIITLFMVFHIFPYADGHAMMCSPRQRGAYTSYKCGTSLSFPPNNIIDHCPHCLNGGTPNTVKTHLPRAGWKVYDPIGDFDNTATRAGLCGDPKMNDDHMIGGLFMPYNKIPVVANYKTGSEVDFTVEIDTNHNGYFEFFVCDMDACRTSDISGSCFKNGHCYLLNRVPHPDCENPKVDTHQDCGPIDLAYPGRWYVPCRKTGHVGLHIVGGSSGTMRYVLPQDLKCEWCVLQWYYATGNSCAPRGFLNYFSEFNDPFGSTCPSDGDGKGGYRPGMHECKDRNVPEEFWTCADVSITEDGLSPGQISAMGSRGSESNSYNGGNGRNGNAKKSPSPSPSSTPTPIEIISSAYDKVAADRSKSSTPTPSPTPSTKKGENRSDFEVVKSRNCVKEEAACIPRGVPCCEDEMVCLYREAVGKTVCRFWWNVGKRR